MELQTFATNADLPADVRDAVSDEGSRTVFRTTFNTALAEGRSETMSFIKAYRAVAKDAPTLSAVHVDRPIGAIAPPEQGKKKSKKTKDEPVEIPTSDNSDLIFKKDVVSLDVPLLIKLLEVAREEVKSDEPLHFLAERLVALSNGSPLSMDDYEEIIASIETEKQKKENADGSPAKTKDDPGTSDAATGTDPIVAAPPAQGSVEKGGPGSGPQVSGFLTRTGEHLPKLPEEMVHSQTARRLGYKGVADALNHGLIRLEGTQHFHYVAHPDAHHTVQDAIRHLSPTEEVHLDIHSHRASDNSNSKLNSFRGTPSEIRTKLQSFIERTKKNEQADEQEPVTKRISGGSNIALNAKGERLAEKLGDRLAELGGLDVLYNSPLKRAVQTADAIVEAAPENSIHRADPAPELQPWHLGEYEGKDVEDVHNLIQHYIENPEEVPPGTGNDDKPGETFKDGVKRQLDFLSHIYEDCEQAPEMKIGAIMHSRGMELVKSWVDAGMPADYELKEEDLTHPDDEPHASVMRWHNSKIKDIDLENDDPLKPGFYLILHSLTDDDTDTGNAELEKKEKTPVEIKKYLPPVEVRHAAQVAYDAGIVVPDITAPLVKDEGLGQEQILKVAAHFAEVSSADEPETSRLAWGGKHAAKWADRVIRKFCPDVEKGFDPDEPRDAHGEWSQGGGSASDAAQPVKLVPSERMIRALESHVPCGKEKQRVADEQERKVSAALGVPRTKDNSAFDLRNEKVGIEVKTMQDSKNGKITMSKDALARKVSEAKDNKIKTYTVVADKRSGGTKYYVAKGLGSFHVSNMTPATLAEIRSMVR